MENNLLVRVGECTEHNMEMIHISAHLENIKHAQVSMLWTGNCLIVTLNARFHLLCEVLLMVVQKLIFPKFQYSVWDIYCVTLDLMFFLFLFFKLLYIWFDSVLMWISSAAIESSHHRLVLKQIRAMWLCELFLLSLWILHSSEWP